MTSPAIGTYTEKRITTQISNLLRQLNELESYIQTPPSLVICNVMNIPSEFPAADWKTRVTNFLTRNNINPNWILKITQPHNDIQFPDSVSIQFISHSVRDLIFNILTQYVASNNFEGVYVTKENL
jgi:hypothetical protein